MTKIVQELNRLKIGVPSITAGNLNRQLADPQLASLLETAVADFESDYWTEERRADMTQMLKRRNRDGQSGRMKRYVDFFVSHLGAKRPIKIFCFPFRCEAAYKDYFVCPSVCILYNMTGQRSELLGGFVGNTIKLGV